MEVLMWVMVIVGAFFVYGLYAGGRLEKQYQKVIADLQYQLTQNPVQFFAPHFHFSSSNFIGQSQVNDLVMLKVIELSLDRNVRSAFNANIIPSDINTLPDVRRDFQRLCMLAYAIANDRH